MSKDSSKALRRTGRPAAPGEGEELKSAPLLSEEDRQGVFREIARSLGQLVRPKPRMNIWQWAEACRYLAKGTSAKALEANERYRSSDAPHQKKPQESCTDPKVQASIWVMASQIGGKTEMFNNVLGYHMDYAPRNCVVMYPQLDSAEKFSKKKFQPMVDATPCLARILKPARSRDSGNTILIKDFLGGAIFFVGANSPASLRGASGAVLMGDEVDSYKANAEGDPVELLWKRGESFAQVVKVLASTPTVKGASTIWTWFEDSDRQYWFVPCVKCGAYQVLKWEQIVWPKNAPEKAEMLCSSCAAALNDSQRLQMYFNGEWRPTAAFHGIAGFHLSGIYAPWPAQKGFQNRLHQMAVEHIRACKGGESTKQVWVNTFLCELWEVETEKVDPISISGRAEGYKPESLPEGVLLIIAAIDVQGDRIECETIGLGEDDETWGIEFKKFYGDTEQDPVWEDLGAHLVKSYKRADGIELRISASGIDMRHKPHKVRNFVKRAGIPRVFPVYGAGGQTPILVTTRFNKHYRLRSFAVNTKIAKDTIFARLRIEGKDGLGGPRFMHYPRGEGYSDEYYLQLTAEVLRRRKEKGVTVEKYEKIRDRNEALDIRVYFLAVIDILKPNLTAIGKRFEQLKASGQAAAEEPKEYQLKPAEESKAPETSPAIAKAKRPPRKFGGGSGFVGRWKK
jgi:phage terminase large subunit GpA-like protein